MELIRRITRDDEKNLREESKANTQGELHHLYRLREHTLSWEIEQVFRIDDAIAAIPQGRLYRVRVGESFPCEYQEVDRNGYDVAVRIHLRIAFERACSGPKAREFARWLGAREFARWPGRWSWKTKRDGDKVAADASFLAKLRGIWTRKTKRDGDKVVTDESLAEYIRSSRDFAKLAALVKSRLENKASASQMTLCADSPSGQLPQVPGLPWLEVVSAEEIDRKPHVEAVKLCPGAMLGGQYKLLKRLGQGSFGQVWKVEDTLLDNAIYAVKILAENADEELARTIANEAATLSALGHDHIANMRGYRKDRNVVFMVEDFVDGTSLEDILARKGGKLSEAETVKWLKPIAEAIDYIHDRGVVHRDIKPTNIMIGAIASAPQAEDAFLCDFGIARKSGNETMFGWGAEFYRAPEVRPGAEVTSAADVYSFAVTAFRCLTGEYPQYYGDKPGADEPGLLRSIRAGLCSNPERRPRKCVDLLTSAQIQTPPPLPLPPPPPPVPSNDVVLPTDVIDKFIYLLSGCGLTDDVKRISGCGEIVLSNGEYGDRIGWRVRNVAAFRKYVKAVPRPSVDEIKAKVAEHYRTGIRDWFRNHAVRDEFDAATAETLQVIFDNITRPEDRWER